MSDSSSIPGLAELQARTRGDARILVAVLDGEPDLTHPCFDGGRLEIARNGWAEDAEPFEVTRRHATHIASVIFGQPGSPVEGVAPECRGLLVPSMVSVNEALSELSLARAIDLAVDAGARVIHVAACQPSQSGQTQEVLRRAVASAQAQGCLIVAPSGNDRGECFCTPAVLPGVLAVGALDDQGAPAAFSNWGGALQSQGIMAPGTGIPGAAPGGGVERQKGTSVSAPIVTGVSALLLSLMLREGREPDARAVREALLASALPCRDDGGRSDERCMRGVLNIPGAIERLLGARATGTAPVASSPATPRSAEPPPRGPVGLRMLAPSSAGAADAAGGRSSAHADIDTRVDASGPPAAVLEQRTAGAERLPGQVFVLGTLGYDFGTEVRRDSFKQLMGPAEHDGSPVPANPYDPREMVRHLQRHPSESRALIWTLNLETMPIYALEPTGPFGAEVHAAYVRLLEGQCDTGPAEARVDRISAPGLLTGRTVRLMSGQVLPVVECMMTRGLHGWNTAALIGALVPGTADAPRVRRALEGFADRVYHDLRNLGRVAPDRALNFALTNAFQLTQAFEDALGLGFELDGIEVVRSPFCRVGSDCWDVQLKFFDPENSRRARKVYRYTVDVSDIVPVTLGPVRQWSVAR